MLGNRQAKDKFPPGQPEGVGKTPGLGPGETRILEEMQRITAVMARVRFLLKDDESGKKRPC
jgi:hypothetical protein